MADSASAPAPAPATGRGRPASAAPGPIELADEKTVQTLATPDSFGAPLARLSPSPTGHGYGSTPPSASTARRGARIHSFFLPPTRAHSTTPPPGMAPGVPRVTPRNYPLFNSEDSATGDSSQSRGGGGSIDWRP